MCQVSKAGLWGKTQKKIFSCPEKRTTGLLFYGLKMGTLIVKIKLEIKAKEEGQVSSAVMIGLREDIVLK
ncbi:MAG: hypothetical protein ACPLRA_05750 [Candidatus Saccharicenans sp.]